jgi:Domain of unknown function (DUF4403)
MRKFNKVQSMPSSNARTSVQRCLCIVGTVVAITTVNPAFALEKPPLSPDQDTPLIVQSKVSAVLSFSARALAEELDRQVPHRLASFEDRETVCGHRRGFFRRKVDIQCVVTGYIERTSPVYLRAQGNRIEAEVKLDGSVYGQGARGLARLVHGVAQGALDVFVDASPRLTPNWNVDLNIAQSYRWAEPPMLRILGRDIPITRYVEPQIRAQSRRVEAEVAAKMRTIDVRDKAEAAWRRAFTPVQIADSTWFRMTPQSVAFAGLRTTSDVLEGAIEFSGPVETDFGATAPTVTPTPLPQLGSDVSNPGHFEFLVPLKLSYQVLREAVQPIASQAFNTTVKDVDVYPSNGKLVVGLQFDSPPQGVDATTTDGWIYLTAQLKPDAAGSSLVLDGAQIGSDKPDANGIDISKVLDALLQKVLADCKPQYEAVLQQANTTLTRDLGGGFKSQGSFTSASVQKIILLKDSIEIIAQATGTLRIVYTP